MSSCGRGRPFLFARGRQLCSRQLCSRQRQAQAASRQGAWSCLAPAASRGFWRPDGFSARQRPAPKISRRCPFASLAPTPRPKNRSRSSHTETPSGCSHPTQCFGRKSPDSPEQGIPRQRVAIEAARSRRCSRSFCAPRTVCTRSLPSLLTRTPSCSLRMKI